MEDTTATNELVISLRLVEEGESPRAGATRDAYDVKTTDYH